MHIHSTPDSRPQTFVSLVEATAHQYADKIAVVDNDDGCMTYCALNGAANRLARAILQEMRICAGGTVLLLDHGIWALIGVLGALKAGSFYIPLDPSFPEEATARMVRDCDVRLVVTNAQHSYQVKQIEPPVQYIEIEDTIDKYNENDLNVFIAPDDWAYMIYTSGSTGCAKGVVHNHGSLLSLLSRYLHSIHVTDRDRLNLLVSFSVTASIAPALATLVAGATLFTFHATEGKITRLARGLAEREITVFQATNSLFRIFCETLVAPLSLPTLRLIRLGGEPTYRNDILLCRQHFPHCIVVNHFGCSEMSTVWEYTIDATVPLPDHLIPVGRIISDADYSLEDEAGSDVGTGEVGEIIIKSTQLAVGYWKQPALTAQSFCADRNGNGQRVYRTGDLGVRLPDGCLVHVGRQDCQIKIRGFRIEPAEIEAVLLTGTYIQEAVVVARRIANDVQIVAYLVAAGAKEIDMSELRRHVRRYLPAHMQPSIMVTIPRLPRLPSGKLDRDSLPIPTVRSSAVLNAPEDHLEKVLGCLFAEVLGIERIDREDDLFDLGGHSLTAARLLSRIRTRMGVDLEFRDVFHGRTVAQLAARLRASDPGDWSLQTPTQEKRSCLSAGQERLWFVNRINGSTAEYNLGDLLRLSGPLQRKALERAFRTMSARHETLRTHFYELDGAPVQMVVEGGEEVDFRFEDLSSLSATAQYMVLSERLKAEKERTFDLCKGPMLRAILIKLGDKDHALIKVVHHIAWDGWSDGIFNKECGMLYDAYVGSSDNPLPPLKARYIDYAAWQKRWLTEGARSYGLRYWARQLDGAVTILNLPTDRIRREAQTFEAAVHHTKLPTVLGDSVRSLCHKYGVTLYMILLAALGILLGRYSGQEDLIVGTPVANRPHEELEHIIGFFVNTLAIRLRLRDDYSFGQFVREGVDGSC